MQCRVDSIYAVVEGAVQGWQYLCSAGLTVSMQLWRVQCRV